MTDMTAPSLETLRNVICDHYLIAEHWLGPQLLKHAPGDAALRRSAQEKAAAFVRTARANAERSGLIDKFLQEYGLSTKEGVTLMRLAEALLRTPDAATANALIEDKIEAGDWAAHKGKSPFQLVNFSTRALMLTAAWLDEVETNDPIGRIAAAAKGALDRLGEPVIRASVAQAMRIMGEHFILGETIDDTIKHGARFERKGYIFSFDMLGEAALTQADAAKYFLDYENAIASIAAHCNSPNPADNQGISVKLSALHPRYEYGKKARVMDELAARVRELAIQAKSANMGFSIDAEETDRLELYLDLVEKLMRDPALEGWDGFGVVLQAYQRRALPVIDWLAALARETGRRVMVRLVKGAYWDAEIKRAQEMGLESYPVFTRKPLTDLSYIVCAQRLLEHKDVFYPQFATHNAMTAVMVREMAGGNNDYEIQRLHGMGEALHDSLIADGARSRIYAPVGSHRDLLPYLVRRLLENGANSSFVNQLIDPDLSVDDVVIDPVEEVRSLIVFANTHIPAPCDHLGGGRIAAEGRDETHPPVASTMSPNARESLGTISARPIINGALRNGDQSCVVNPARITETVGTVEAAPIADVEAACAIATEFAPHWAAQGPAFRADILRRAADLLEMRAHHFMTLAVFEAGKAWPDAIAEIREAVDFLRYYADGAETLTGEPTGVIACISPWNFPLAIFLGQVSASLAAGNCVIAKPAEQTPLIAFEAVRLLHEAGVPGGALHYLPGDGPTIGAPLVANHNVNGVVFTGSTQTAKRIKKTLVEEGNLNASLIAETGGINAMIVDSTALLEQAVADTVSSAFQSAGQRCSACRVVCVQEDVADRYIDMLQGAVAELAIGDPALRSTDVGPVIDAEACEAIQAHINRLNKEARLIARAPDLKGDGNGNFIRPAAFEVNALSDLDTEIFGPVLQLVRFQASALESLIDDVNALGYGLTMGAHTRIDETMHAISQRARVGNLYVNRNQIGAVVGVQPFGGEGLSGTGPKAGGPHYLEALTRRPVTDGDAPAALAPSNTLTAEEEQALKCAGGAYFDWNHADRSSILRAVAEALPAHRDIYLDAAALFESAFHPSFELPGPTGEANTLKLRGRGTLLCLGGGDDASLHRQIALALSAGNSAIMPPDAAPVMKALAQAKAPDGAACVSTYPVSQALLNDSRLAGVMFDGGAKGKETLETALCARDGAIIPVLSSRDAPWRLAVERTLTVNTTAAGGDVRLLSLSE